MLLTYALALSASQFMHKKKSLRIYTSMRSGGLEPTQLTSYSKHEEDDLLLVHHRGDRSVCVCFSNTNIKTDPQAAKVTTSATDSTCTSPGARFFMLIEASNDRDSPLDSYISGSAAHSMRRPPTPPQS